MELFSSQKPSRNTGTVLLHYTYFSDLIVGETTCDGKKKMYELLNRIKPTYVLHLPQGHDSDPLTTWTADPEANRGCKRIMVTGCPIGGVLQKTVGAIEANGGVVVCHENCSGIKAAFQMVDTEAEDIVKAIAERYLKIGCSVLTPNSRRMEIIPELVKEFKIDGIVDVDLQACTPYCVESYQIRELAEKLGVPYMAVETDYSQSDSGQLSTRIEAFMEML